MTAFKDFNIKTTSKSFVGDKIKMNKILNKEISVVDFKIADTKIYNSTKPKCLHLQISVGDQKHVVFTSAVGLIEQIQQVPQDKFPFTTTIIDDNERFLFT